MSGGHRAQSPSAIPPAIQVASGLCPLSNCDHNCEVMMCLFKNLFGACQMNQCCLSSYLQKTSWHLSPASVRTRRAIVRRMCGSSATTSNRTQPRWSARGGIREMKWDLPLSLVCARCTFPEVFAHYRWNLRSVHCRWNQTFLFSFVSLLFSMWIPPACDRSTFLNIFGQYSLWLKIY